MRGLLRDAALATDPGPGDTVLALDGDSGFEKSIDVALESGDSANQVDMIGCKQLVQSGAQDVERALQLIGDTFRERLIDDGLVSTRNSKPHRCRSLLEEHPE